MIDSAAYLSAVSVMLGAYGFFYGNFRDVIRAGLEVEERSDNDNIRARNRREVDAALNAASALALVALAVWLIFLGPVVEEIEAAFAVCFSLDHYSAIDVAFVAAASAWLPIALVVGSQAVRLWRKRRELK